MKKIKYKAFLTLIAIKYKDNKIISIERKKQIKEFNNERYMKALKHEKQKIDDKKANIIY